MAEGERMTQAERIERARIAIKYDKRYRDMTGTQVARELGISATTVNKIKALMGIPAQLAAERTAKIERMIASPEFGLKERQSKQSIAWLAKHFDLPKTAVRNEQVRRRVKSTQGDWSPREPLVSVPSNIVREITALIKGWAVPEGLPEHVKELRRARV